MFSFVWNWVRISDTAATNDRNHRDANTLGNIRHCIKPLIQYHALCNHHPNRLPLFNYTMYNKFPRIKIESRGPKLVWAVIVPAANVKECRSVHLCGCSVLIGRSTAQKMLFFVFVVPHIMTESLRVLTCFNELGSYDLYHPSIS